MCQNGSRRRTPGGVYLFLLKDDPGITREQQDVIFYGSVEERRRQQKQAKQRRWRYHRDNIAESHLADVLRPLPDCRDLCVLDRLSGGGAELCCQSSLADDSNDTAAAAGAGDGSGEKVDDVTDDDVQIELDLV